MMAATCTVPGIVHRTAEGDTENYLIIGPGPPDTARCRHLFQQKPADRRPLRPLPAPIANAYITHKLRANSTGKLKTKKKTIAIHRTAAK
ncbi:hypothetical protein QR685DRAFT_569709 [Neurospora intermedia]|uniref:Uncharacterized protein n=1 Tax=Neurospora intermedia TaxID=5142 RepID=A0ABR3DLY2_NEUIN